MKNKLETFIELAHLNVDDNIKNDLRKNIKAIKNGFKTNSNIDRKINITNQNDDTKMTIVFDTYLVNNLRYVETGTFEIKSQKVQTKLVGKIFANGKLIATLYKEEVKYSSLGKKLISNGYDVSPFMWTLEEVNEIK